MVNTRKTYIVLILLGVTTMMLFGCSMDRVGPKPTGAPELASYKHSYIGDASAVGAVIGKGLGSEYGNGYELSTSKEPYGLIIHYKWKEAQRESKKGYFSYWSNETAPYTALSNAMLLFSYVDNAEWVTFRFATKEGGQDEELTVQRDELERIVGFSLKELPSQEAELWKEIMKLTHLHQDAFQNQTEQWSKSLK